MIEQLLQYDTELFILLNNLGSTTWDSLWLVITNKLTFIPLYAILLYLLYKHYGIKSMLIFVIAIALMIIFTDQITNVFKHTFKRPRPCGVSDLEEQIRFIAVRCGKYSFFSGHSSNSMAAAIFVGLMLKSYYKKLLFILIIWSVVVAYSRIYVGVHYPIDIIFGMIFGIFSGGLFFYVTKYVLTRFFNISPLKF